MSCRLCGVFDCLNCIFMLPELCHCVWPGVRESKLKNRVTEYLLLRVVTITDIWSKSSLDLPHYTR